VGGSVGADPRAGSGGRRCACSGHALLLERRASLTPLDRLASAAAESAPLTRVARQGLGLSTYSVHQRRADTVAGFLCAFSFALSGLAIALKPGLLAPVAILLALAAARMTESHRTLAGAAVIVATLGFFFGMIVAISTDNPLF